ncbi:MAG TPA: 2-phospho-L-lactate transferase [Actinomycetota bacterium]|nr:2-phospho-L-lactate transferase [Actinomycetota bacterium]
MKVVALAGGVGAGKFLRGLVRIVPPRDVTAVVNTADDMTLHGLRICPDLDSVTYWLAGVADRDRGWGRAGESFRALEEVRRLGGDAWFGLGDLDLGTHLVRTGALAAGATLSEVTGRMTAALGVEARVVPMSDDPVTTWIDSVDAGGEPRSDPFQTYWVGRGARDEVKAVRFEGAERARPAPGVLDAIGDADGVLFCPSNPVVSLAPILAVPGIRDAVAARSERASGVSPIVGGAPVAGMADRLMPAVGLEVSALGAAAAYRGLLHGWVVDERDADLADRIADEVGMRVSVTDTIMADDTAAARVARAALDLAAG